MDRRNLLLAAGGVALAASAQLANADQIEPHQHGAGSSPLLDSAVHCVKTGEIAKHTALIGWPRATSPWPRAPVRSTP